MARWRLNLDHYIYAYRQRRGTMTEWEYTETDRMTGEEVRSRFKVPLYCEKDWIVSTLGSEDPMDNGRIGPIILDPARVHPTPEMVPLDAEAKEIQARFAEGWVQPMSEEAFPTTGGFAEQLLSGLERQLDELNRKMPVAPVPVAQAGVSLEEFNELKAQLAALMAEKAERQATRPEGRRRV